MEIAKKKEIKKLNLEELVREIYNIAPEIDNICISGKVKFFEVMHSTLEHNTIICNGETIYQAFKRLYQIHYKNPVLQKPSGYDYGGLEELVVKLTPYFHGMITIQPLKDGRFYAVGPLKENSIEVIGYGINIHHSLVSLMRDIKDKGIDI